MFNDHDGAIIQQIEKQIGKQLREVSLEEKWGVTRGIVKNCPKKDEGGKECLN